MTIMQGDSYLIPIRLTQAGVSLTPEMIDDLEVCVGTHLRYTLSDGSVIYDENTTMWYIRPSQEETFALPEDSYTVIARVKYLNTPMADVKGIKVGHLDIQNSHSREVL